MNWLNALLILTQKLASSPSVKWDLPTMVIPSKSAKIASVSKTMKVLFLVSTRFLCRKRGNFVLMSLFERTFGV